MIPVENDQSACRRLVFYSAMDPPGKVDAAGQQREGLPAGQGANAPGGWEFRRAEVNLYQLR